jgi:hypothetical protein
MPILLSHIAYQRIKSFSLEVCDRELHQFTSHSSPVPSLEIGNILHKLKTDSNIDNMFWRILSPIRVSLQDVQMI